MKQYRSFLWWVPVAMLLLGCTLSDAVTTLTPSPSGAPSKTAVLPAASTAEIIDAAPTAWVMTVCSDGLNVRSEPDPSALVVGGLVRGQTVTAFESLDGWLRVGVGRWVRGSYLHADGGACLGGVQ